MRGDRALCRALRTQANGGEGWGQDRFGGGALASFLNQTAHHHRRVRTCLRISKLLARLDKRAQ